MKYYLIAGEASGDLHASHLIAALKERDPEAVFRCYGGDMMQAQGAQLVGHYRDMAYMGIWPVLLHARTILRKMSELPERTPPERSRCSPRAGRFSPPRLRRAQGFQKDIFSRSRPRIPPRRAFRTR